MMTTQSKSTLKEKKPRYGKVISGVVCQIDVRCGKVIVGSGWITWDFMYGAQDATIINNDGFILDELPGYIYETRDNNLALISWSVH